MTIASRLSLTDGPEFFDPTVYRSIVGSQQYISHTLPDVAFAVNKVC